MFVLLIGLPGPRPLGPPRASFPPIKCSPCGSISRQPTRALTPREEVEDRGPSRTDLRARGLLLSSRLVSRLSPWLSCPLSVAGAHQGLTFAPNVRNIVRLCAALTRQPCLSVARVAFICESAYSCSFRLNEPARDNRRCFWGNTRVPGGCAAVVDNRRGGCCV